MQLKYVGRWAGAALGIALMISCPQAALTAPKDRDPGPVLIFHDSAGPYGWIGRLHARMLANLLGHFDLSYRILPVESYRPGTLAQGGATFYLGNTFDNPLPAAFIEDVL